MNRQSQWLFEAPFVLERDRNTSPQYYSYFELGAKRMPWWASEVEAEGIFGPCGDDAISDYDIYPYGVRFHVEFNSFRREVERTIGQSLNKLQIEALRQNHQIRLCEGLRSGDQTSVLLIVYFTDPQKRKRYCGFEVMRISEEKCNAKKSRIRQKKSKVRS